MLRARVSVNKLCECLCAVRFFTLVTLAMSLPLAERVLCQSLPCHLHSWNFNSTCNSLFIHIFVMFKSPSACCWINAEPENTKPNGWLCNLTPFCSALLQLTFHLLQLDPCTALTSTRNFSQRTYSPNAKHFWLRAIKFCFHCWSCFVHAILCLKDAFAWHRSEYCRRNGTEGHRNKYSVSHGMFVILA